MWSLIAVTLAAVVVSGYFITDTRERAIFAQIDKTNHVVQQTTSMMVQVMRECAKRSSAGHYSVSTLMPAGFPAMTPAGPGIVCVVRASGTLPTGRSAFVYLDAGVSNIPTSGLAGNDQAQKKMAYAIAGRLARQAAGQEGGSTTSLPDTIAGVVIKGSAAPTLLTVMDGRNSVDLTGVLVANFPYSTPVLAAGVLSSII